MYIEKEKENIDGMFWFTSDTHFGAQRTLELTKRPFPNVEVMDQAMINNWNSYIGEDDIVFHAGDFGDYQVLSQLNGKRINLILGNYELKDITENFGGDDIAFQKHIQEVNPNVNIWYQLKASIELNSEQIKDSNMSSPLFNFELVHKPSDITISEAKEGFSLFGHIHRAQMVKVNALNIGVDCHNYKPVSLDEVLFWRNAIINHYDKEVWTHNYN